ncbi:LysR family transcriptional regulator [Lichenifustis flavocetrariae]|uniref:LysR family transcriptional regulator n=1 Tax=Lichenifustis flavocetrariae TaxID=2949735 RepID=A0AA41YSL2_9HYPH|nr:LysR family transcriptional regulator [Lichenifustis flavocetrariae]MCW6506555.1 LysR family transcriptional regulator [Lichenifustis flavocetrariae]
MVRNIDTALIRAFTTVADTASMTAAAEALHLTQAAISQQIKRLEEAFGTTLFDRDRKGLALTNDGERLYARAKRLLGMNDEIWAEMTTAAFDGEVRLGVPYDLVGNYMPAILKAFASAHPKVEITLTCMTSPDLIEALAADRLDLVIAEEPFGRSRGECILTDRLVWVGAKGGDAFRRRPLPISLGCETCAFRPVLFEALKKSSLPWRTVAESDGTFAISATVQTDLAVTALLASTIVPGLDVLSSGSGLPPLPNFTVNLHLPPTGTSPVVQALAETVRQGFLGRQRQAAA